MHQEVEVPEEMEATAAETMPPRWIRDLEQAQSVWFERLMEYARAVLAAGELNTNTLELTGIAATDPEGVWLSARVYFPLARTGIQPWETVCENLQSGRDIEISNRMADARQNFYGEHDL